MRFLQRSLIGTALMALTLGGFIAAAGLVWQAIETRRADNAPPPPNAERPVAVNPVVVRAGTATPVIESFGEIRSARTLDVRAAADGRVVELAEAFREGGRVRAGEILARIDPAEAEAGLAVASADLAEAEGDLQAAERDLSLARDDLAVAEEQADLRAQALARQEDLRGRGVGSAQAVETAALEAAQARASVVSRRQALAQAQTAMAQSRTHLQRMRVALDEARRLRADTEIRAKFAGTLAEVAVVEGGLVARNEQLAMLVDPDALEVAFRLSTGQYARLRSAPAGGLVAPDISVRLEAGDATLSTTAELQRESAVVGEGQTGRLLFARLAEAAGFRPGDIVTVSLTEPVLEGVARLPALAVDAAETVLVIGADDRLQIAEVDLVRRQGDSVLVRAADLEGREIVAERTPSLGAGILIERLAPPANEPAAAQVPGPALAPAVDRGAPGAPAGADESSPDRTQDEAQAGPTAGGRHHG